MWHEARTERLCLPSGRFFFSFSAAEQWLNKWFKELRLLHSKGTLYSGLKEKKKRNYGHNKAMHALERGCGNVACLGERKEINEN